MPRRERTPATAPTGITGPLQPATVSPDLSGRSATATLSPGESRITARAPRWSELAIPVVRLDRIHAADQRAPHFAFGRDHVLGLGDDFFR